MPGVAHWLRLSDVQGAPLSEHVPVAQKPSVSSVVKLPPLLKQSMRSIQEVIADVSMLFVHVILQLLYRLSREGSPVQVLPASLMQQLRAIAVNWRASCSLMLPLGLTQIASTAEFMSFRSVLSMMPPQTSRQPPQALMTSCVMFWLGLFGLSFSVPACVPQNPGVRHIAVTQGGRVQVADWNATGPVLQPLAVALTEPPLLVMVPFDTLLEVQVTSAGCPA